MKTRSQYNKQTQARNHGTKDRMDKIVARAKKQPFSLPRDPFVVEIKGVVKGKRIG